MDENKLRQSVNDLSENINILCKGLNGIERNILEFEEQMDNAETGKLTQNILEAQKIYKNLNKTRRAFQINYSHVLDLYLDLSKLF